MCIRDRLYTKRDYTTKRVGMLFDNPTFQTINEGFGLSLIHICKNRTMWNMVWVSKNTITKGALSVPTSVMCPL